MTNLKLNDFNLSFGLCEITYGDVILPSLGDQGVFSAIPKYLKLNGGKNNVIQKYLLQEYEVSFEVMFDKEAIEMMQYYMPTLQSYKNGFYDSANNVAMDSKQLIIHPYLANTSKQYDICIWNAIIDPETGFQRTYGKEINKYKVKFIGNPVKNNADLVNSYFYIGDWSQVGVNNVG
jgi:hypothetical protein